LSFFKILFRLHPPIYNYIMKPSFRFLPALSPKAKRQLRASGLSGAFAIGALVTTRSAQATDLYWDVNGAPLVSPLS